MALPGLQKSAPVTDITRTVNRLVQAFNQERNALTVANLPDAAREGKGARAFVSDADATTFGAVVAGSGTNSVPVYSDGTDWRIG
jgi:hypothetical protein